MKRAARLRLFTRPFLFAMGLLVPACDHHLEEKEVGNPAPQKESGEILAGLDDFKKSWEKADNPKADGWDSEAFNSAAGAQLNELGEWLLDTDSDPDELPTWFADQVEILFGDADQDFQSIDTDGFSVIRRSAKGELREYSAGDLAKEFQKQFGWLRRSDGSRFKFKIYELQRASDDSEISGRIKVALAGEVEGKMREHHADWRVTWSGGDFDQEHPRLASVLATETESARAKGAAGGCTLFSDCTESVLSGSACYESQILRGLNHWLKRVPFRLPVTLFGTPGLAVGDVNGDGLEDLYLCQESGIPNRLFLQNADGTATEVAQKWGVDWIDDSRSALFLDLDNDGDQDLVLAGFRNVIVASNERQAGFKVRAVLPASETLMSMCAADYDSDGRVDLFICAYDPDELFEEKIGQIAVSAGPFVYYDSNNGAPNSLFKNEVKGDQWEFVDVTQSCGLDVNNRRWSYAASWEDFDSDGDQDLYVANDFGRNNLYRNDGGKFTDIAAQAGAEDSASGMSASWGDYDRDGDMDLHVGNMWSSAGRRIVPQAAFKPEIGADMRGVFKRFARGNSLMRNVDGEHFEDVSEESGVTLGRWAWSSPFVDINNNGWEDLVVANGYITGEGSGDL